MSDISTKMVKEKKQHKPKAKLIGADSNIFNLLGIAKDALRKNGAADKIKEITERVTHSHSYDEALCIIMEYVDPM
jgi:hypothetical protein